MLRILIGVCLVLAATVASTDAQTFHGYPCTQDCSGHEAGYQWAEQRGIGDPGDCGGNSNSFIEGCEAWAQEQQDFGESTEESPDYSADDPDASGDF